MQREQVVGKSEQISLRALGTGGGGGGLQAGARNAWARAMASPRDDEECFAIPSGASFCGPGKTDIAQHQHQAFRGPESQQASPYNTNSYVDRDESSKDCEEDDFVSESDLATATCKGEAVVDADDDDGNVDKHHYHDGNDDDSQAFAEDSNYDDDSDDNDDVSNGRRRDDQLGTEKVASSDSEENDSDVNEHGQNDRPTRPETVFFTALSDDESSDELDENALFSRHNEELKLQAKGEAPTRPVVREVGPSRIHAERSYYDGLPFGPGPGMLFHLQPLSSKPKSSLTRKHASGAGVQNGLRRHRRDGVLHVRMPDTAVFGRQGRRVLLRFSSKAQGMVTSSLEADAWEETLCKKWLAEARPVGVEHEPIVAVLKFPSWLHVEGSETRLVNAATLLGRLEQRPNICVVQRFVNPKGAKPSVYRATWRRDKLPIVVNITASRTFREASRDAHARQDADVLRHDHGQSTQNSKNQNEDSSDERLVTVPQAQHFFEERLLSEWFCPGSADTDKTTIFKVANVAVSQVHEALTRIARHLEASIGREYGLRKFAFEQLQCDLMRSKSDEWILTNVRGFELTPEAYREAHQVELEIRHRREAQGDYYDSEDEEVHNKQRRQYVRRQHGYERNGARSLRANGTRRLCAMCSRPILPDEKVPCRPRDTNQVSAATSSAVEQFPTVSEATSAEGSNEISTSEQKRKKPDNPKQKKPEESAAKTNFEMTSVLARVLRTQLMLRGRRVVAFDNCLFARNESRFENGILVPGSSAAVGNSFQVCKLCHALWEANETLVHTGKEIGASWLPQNIRAQKNHGNQVRSPTRAETPAKASRTKVNARKKKANVKDPTNPSTRALLERVASSGQDARARADSERNAGQTEVYDGDSQPKIIIPGAPSYGAKPGSRAGYIFCGSEEDMYRPKTESLKMTSTTAGVAAAKDARETKLNPAHARLQFRLTIFLRDIVGLPGEKLDLQYRFHPWAGTVSIPVSRGTGKDSVCTVRQIRVHYFMASRVGLQQLFMQPLVVKLSRHEGVDKEEMPQSIEYHGELFLTRFLASFARHSLVNFDLRLHPSSEAASGHGEAPLLRCAIGIIRDGLHLTELDPGMPLAVDGAVLHLPPNYFDVRPLPESWISSIVAGQQRLASKSDDDGDKSMAQGTGNGQASDGPPGTLPSTDVSETRPSQRWRAHAARRPFHQGRETERLHGQAPILKETSQVIQEVVAMGHAGAGASVVLDSAEAWEQAAAFFEDVQEACEGLPVSRATLIAEAMKRAKNQNHANQNLRDDAQGTSETETSTTSLLAQSAGAADAGEDELDWATIVAMLQDPRMKTFADDMQDGNLSRIARRRASECMVFTKDTFLLYLQHRAKELALQTSSLVPHEDGVEVQATEKTSECDNASAAKAWSLGLFSRRVKKDAVVRRYLRFRAYARIWACIDIDQNGRLDAAELRAYVRQRQTLEDPRAIYSKAFADWSLREMHAHLCMWLGASARANEKFERYDVDASGLISWEEFVNMADRAFRDEALDEISFSVSQGYGECPRHGKTRVYSIDLSCVACEIAKHDPSRAWDQDLLTNLNPEILSKVKTAAGRMLRRLSYGVHDDVNPLLSREQEPSQSSRSVLDMLSPSMHTVSDAPGSGALHSRPPSRRRTAERKRAGLTNVEEEDDDSDVDDWDESREDRTEKGTSKEGIAKKLQKRASKDGRRHSRKVPTEGTSGEDLTRATSRPRLQLESVPSFKSSLGSNSKRRMTKTPKRKKTLNKTGQRQSVKVSALAPLRKSGPSVARQRPLDRIGDSQIERLSHHHTVNTRQKRKTCAQRSTINANLSFLDALSTEVANFRDAGSNESYVCTTPSNCSKRGGTKRKTLRPSRSASQLMSARPMRSSPSQPGENEASEAKSLRSQQAAERKQSLALLHDAEVETLLVYAKFGNVHQARRLLAQGKVKPSTQLHGRLPLHEAAAAGQREMAELLLASGANANATDAEGLTAAQVAAQAGHRDFAAWLSSRT